MEEVFYSQEDMLSFAQFLYDSRRNNNMGTIGEIFNLWKDGQTELTEKVQETVSGNDEAFWTDGTTLTQGE